MYNRARAARAAHPGPGLSAIHVRPLVGRVPDARPIAGHPPVCMISITDCDSCSCRSGAAPAPRKPRQPAGARSTGSTRPRPPPGPLPNRRAAACQIELANAEAIRFDTRTSGAQAESSCAAPYAVQTINVTARGPVKSGPGTNKTRSSRAPRRQSQSNRYRIRMPMLLRTTPTWHPPYSCTAHASPYGNITAAQACDLLRHRFRCQQTG